MAAPVGGQILSEVLPYLELQEDNNNEEQSKIIEVEVPELRNKSIEDAKKQLEELGLEMQINNETEENVNKNIMNQIPLPGIKINSGSKIYVDI